VLGNQLGRHQRLKRGAKGHSATNGAPGLEEHDRFFFIERQHSIDLATIERLVSEIDGLVRSGRAHAPFLLYGSSLRTTYEAVSLLRRNGEIF
jgi:hypothetical protein